MCEELDDALPQPVLAYQGFDTSTAEDVDDVFYDASEVSALVRTTDLPTDKG